MTVALPPLTELPSALRAARRSRRVSIVTLAAEAAVSPRLISEFEQGKRPNVSLETVLRLLALVGVSIRVAGTEEQGQADQARARRAALRRQSWSGSQSTLLSQADPAAPELAAARLGAVASASILASALQHAPRTMP